MKKYMIIISVVLIFFIGLIMIFYPNIRNKTTKATVPKMESAAFLFV